MEINAKGGEILGENIRGREIDMRMERGKGEAYKVKKIVGCARIV